MKVTTLAAPPKSKTNLVVNCGVGTYFKHKEADNVYIKTNVNTAVCLTTSNGVSFPMSAFGDGSTYEEVTLEELVIRKVL